VFDALEKMKSDKKAQAEVEKALAEQKLRLESEFQKILQIQNLDERRAEEVRIQVTNDILTLKCPRCKTAFVDFEGCFALTCGRCRAGFCAWCLADCGADAHAHVANCPENQNRGSYFGSENDFKTHHNRRRHRQVLDMIGKEKPDVQNLLREKLRRELNDLGIQLNDPNQVQGGGGGGAGGAILAAVRGIFGGR
jgi:hypothetical protein